MVDNYCVYLIKFDDESVYVGSSKNIKERIRKHNYNSKIKLKNRPLYLKMNESDWNLEILVENIPSKKEALSIEESITLEYRNNGLCVLNIYNGSKLDEESRKK